VKPTTALLLALVVVLSGCIWSSDSKPEEPEPTITVMMTRKISWDEAKSFGNEYSMVLLRGRYGGLGWAYSVDRAKVNEEVSAEEIAEAVRADTRGLVEQVTVSSAIAIPE
jgi:hypothetical protein